MDAGEPTRDENGRFLKGVSGNPAGTSRPWQPYGERLKKWLDMSASEIKAVVSDMERLERLSAIDVACVKHVVRLMFGKDAQKALDAALDRIEGRAIQKTELTGKDGGSINVNGAADATREVFALMGTVAAAKQSGGAQEDGVDQGGKTEPAAP